MTKKTLKGPIKSNANGGVKRPRKPRIKKESQPSLNESSVLNESRITDLTELIINEHLADEKLSQLSVLRQMSYVMKNVFGHKGYKSEEQKKAIKYAIEGKGDLYVSFPTGGGKSLCFQLPAVVVRKVTIVFSPLIALIQDQVQSLRAKNIPACSWNSTITSEERSFIARDLFSDYPTFRLVYTTPESAKTDFFKKMVSSLISKNLINFFVCDEAHTVPNWGETFRPAYLQLGELRNLGKNIKWIALTATANKGVQESIHNYLGMQQIRQFKTSCYRSNLYYDVIYEETLLEPIKEDILKFINRIISFYKEYHAGVAVTGIIYCRSREQCEALADFLTKRDLVSAFYHAQLDPLVKNEVQRKFMAKEVSVITATIAFGMGVDCDSKFVVHLTPPSDLASYYQESGRAGRDGSRSYCRIYYSNEIRKKNLYFKSNDLQQVDKGNDTPEVKAKKMGTIEETYAKMFEYCESPKCRHSMLSKYFDDNTLVECFGNCDVCRDSPKVNLAKAFFNQVKNNPQVLYSAAFKENLKKLIPIKAVNLPEGEYKKS
uniref:ATP-dependent DNA helicase n=1 Tax=Rhabditophanes sp. KR3021 TaxID=114890 RepID=A0AC35TZK0_9BILA